MTATQTPVGSLRCYQQYYITVATSARPLTLGGLPGLVSVAGDVLRSPTSTVARAPLT